MKIEQLFEGSYLYLLVDQYEDGLWGRSMSTEQEEFYASAEEKHFLRGRGQVKSTTVTYMATDAILRYTRNPNSPVFMRILDFLPFHRDKDGGYGTLGEMISPRPKPIYRVLSNTRHTATALLIYVLLGQKPDESTIESYEFIVDNAKPGGGWGLPSEEADCCSTAYVLNLLTLAKNSDLRRSFSSEYFEKMSKTISEGIAWLRNNNRKGGGYWFYPGTVANYTDSAEVLTYFSSLGDYDCDLYKANLRRLAELHGPDHGWPLSPNGRSELTATIWIANALASSNCEEYKPMVEGSIDFILRSISDPAHTARMSSDSWALILRLSGWAGFTLAPFREYQLKEGFYSKPRK